MLSRSFPLLEYRIVWRRADLILTILFWIQLFVLKGFHFLTIVSVGCTPFAKNDLRYFRCILVTENLSCWCCLRTESSFWKAEDLASQIGCYWHDGPKLDWWQSPCDRHPPASPPHQPHKKSDGLSEGRLTWLPSIYSVYTSPFQSGPIKMYQRPKSMKLFSRQNLTCKYFLDKIRESCINHSCNIKAESPVSCQKCLVWKNVSTLLFRTCLRDFQTVTKCQCQCWCWFWRGFIYHMNYGEVAWHSERSHGSNSLERFREL